MLKTMRLTIISGVLLQSLACSQAKTEEAPELKVATPTDPCGERNPCTRDYRPHICRFADQDFWGPNRCEALNKAREFACKKGLPFSEQDISCRAITLPQPTPTQE